MTTRTTSPTKPQDHKAKTIDLTIKRPTKGVELCLDLSLRAQWEKLEAELRTARNDPSQDQRLAGGPIQALAAELTSLEEDMAAATVVFTLTALTRREWSRLITDHPAREGDAGDKTLGFNEESLFDAAIPLSVTSAHGPEGEPIDWDPEKWVALADEMTNRQYEDFKVAVFELNVGGSARLPKSMLASVVTARSETS